MYLRHKYTIKDPKNSNLFVFNDNIEKRKDTENTIKDMNINSNLGFDLLSPYEDEVIEKLEKCSDECIDNYMSNDYYADGITWIFSGYPHDESSDFLTEIIVVSNKYNVYGIKVGDNISSSINTLKKINFKKIEEKDFEHKYCKNDLSITFITRNRENLSQKDIITEIIIYVKTWYLGNFIY